jgi:Fe-S cluster biogenesis protein NfuA
LKFIPGEQVLKSGTITYNKEDDLKGSPLANELFKIEGVNSLFFTENFISVTKDADFSWEVLKPMILACIMDHFVALRPIVMDEDINQLDAIIEEEPSEITEQIKELIETRVRPAVAQDGGDIVYRGFRDGVVYLELHGACSGCPSSSVTLKSGIENMLKHYIPEVKSVESV